MLGPRRHRALFFAVFGLLTALSALPFWLTRILPMQDYPHFLLFARAFGDCRLPGSPFHGAYDGVPLSPLVLPIALTRALARVSSFEAAGRAIWTLYAVGLPLSALYLLSALRRDPWGVVLVFPLVISYWVIGGFFAFATGMPLLLLGLAAAVRWLEAPTLRRGAWLAAILAASFLWHALIFAQLALDFGLLWCLHRAESGRARARALAPVLPAALLFAAWVMASIQGHGPGRKPPVWPPFLDNATRFFAYLGPLPQAAGAAFLLVLVLAVGAATEAAPQLDASPAFRVKAPFKWLSIAAVLGYALLPSTCFGVEGINNRQPYLAALLFVFGWSLPRRRGRARSCSGRSGAPRRSGSRTWRGASRRSIARRRARRGCSIASRRGRRCSRRSIARRRSRSREAAGGARSLRVDPRRRAPQRVLRRLRHQPGSLRQRSEPDARPLARRVARSAGLKRFDYVLVRAPVSAAVERDRSLRLVAKDEGFALFSVCGAASSRRARRRSRRRRSRRHPRPHGLDAILEVAPPRLVDDHAAEAGLEVDLGEGEDLLREG